MKVSLVATVSSAIRFSMIAVAAAVDLKRAANAANEVSSGIIGTIQDEYDSQTMPGQKLILILTVEMVEVDLEKREKL